MAMATCREIRASDALYLFNKVKRALDLGTFDQASLENDIETMRLPRFGGGSISGIFVFPHHLP
jgi:hypothetical protein